MWGIKVDWTEGGLECCDWLECWGEHPTFTTEAEAQAFIDTLPGKPAYDCIYTPQKIDESKKRFSTTHI